MELQLPSAAEAIRIIQAIQGRSIAFADFRVVKSLSEYIDYSPDHNRMLNTSQQFEQTNTHGTNAISVRTELQTHIPIRMPGEVGSEQPSTMVRLAFAVGTTYVFGPEFTELERIVFGKVYGILHTYPYWRVFMNSSMSQMGAIPQIAAIIDLDQAAKMAGFPQESSDVAESAAEG